MLPLFLIGSRQWIDSGVPGGTGRDRCQTVNFVNFAVGKTMFCGAASGMEMPRSLGVPARDHVISPGGSVARPPWRPLESLLLPGAVQPRFRRSNLDREVLG